MANKRPKLALDLVAKVQLDMARDSPLKTQKRGKPPTGEQAKAPTKSPTKLVNPIDPPLPHLSNAPSGQGFEVIT